MTSRRQIRQVIESVKPTVVDRMVGYFSPESGVRRYRARAMQALWSGGVYPSAKKSNRRLSEWNPNASASFDDEALDDIPVLREQARDLVRSAPVAAGAISTKVANIVGPGLRVQSEIDRDFLNMDDEQATAWQNAAEREFRLWADSPNCDLERSCYFADIQALSFRAVMENGDHFVTLPFLKRPGDVYGLKMQMIEADRVSNPGNREDTDTLVMGVEKDENGAPVRYHIADHHPGGIKGAQAKWSAADAYDELGLRRVLHLHPRLRAHQTRGVPELAPVIESLKQLDRYTDAEIDAAVVSSFLTVFIQSEEGGDGGMFGPMEPTTETGGKSTDKDYKLAPAAILALDEGESVETLTPGRPNTAFEPFVQAVLRHVGAAIELPYEMLVKQFTASYSASRAALLEAWQHFRMRRAWMVRYLCQPVYEALITEAVATGRLDAPGFFDDPAIRAAYLQTEWIGPPQGQLDPTKETKAAVERIDAELSTRKGEAAALGRDWDQVHRQRTEEERRRREDQTGPSGGGGAPMRDTPPDDAGDDEPGDGETGDDETQTARMAGNQ